jgi:hypothetical protein
MEERLPEIKQRLDRVRDILSKHSIYNIVLGTALNNYNMKNCSWLGALASQSMRTDTASLPPTTREFCSFFQTSQSSMSTEVNFDIDVKGVKSHLMTNLSDNEASDIWSSIEFANTIKSMHEDLDYLEAQLSLFSIEELYKVSKDPTGNILFCIKFGSLKGQDDERISSFYQNIKVNNEAIVPTETLTDKATALLFKDE